MFYFFEKNAEYIRCEIRAHGGGWDVVTLEPGHEERVEHYPSSQAANTRWEDLQREFRRAGWFGPYGRD